MCGASCSMANIAFLVRSVSAWATGMMARRSALPASATLPGKRCTPGFVNSSIITGLNGRHHGQHSEICEEGLFPMLCVRLAS